MSAAPRTSTQHTTLYRALFLRHEPASKARMNGPQASAKYTTLHAPLSDADIQAHLDGSSTFATPMIGPSGLSCEAALDYDHNGKTAAKQALAAAARHGLTAWAEIKEREGETTAHIRFLFDRLTEPTRLHDAAKNIAREVTVKVDKIYPTRAQLRDPLGIHTWSGTRGTLLFQDGSTITLDAPGGVAAGLDAIAALPQNRVDALPHAEPPKAQPTAARVDTCHDGSIIEQYNRQTDLIALLEQHGGKIAYRYMDGRVIFHCPCGKHSHGDRRPSLEVKPATKQRYGKYIAVGYSSTCAFYTERGQVIDAFGAHRILSKLSAGEAVKQLAPPQERRTGTPPEPEPEPPPRTPTAAERRRREQERQQRIAEARATQTEIRARAESDNALNASDRLVLDDLLTVAGNRDWCRPSNDSIAERTNLSKRTVQRSLQKLEARGYIERDPGTAKGGRSTTIRRFLRVTAQPSEQQPVSPVLENKLVLNPPVLAYEPPHDTPTPETEPVSAFDGGASYVPVDLPDDPPARDWHSNLPPKEFYAEFVAPRERRARQAEQLPPTPQPTAHVAEQPALEIAPAGPSRLPLLAQPPAASKPKPKRRRRVSCDADALPADKAQALADKYGKLIGKASKVERSKPRQAAKLRRQAADVKKELDAMPLPIEAAIAATPALDSQTEGSSCGRSQAPPKGEGVYPSTEPPPALSHLPAWQAAQCWTDWCKRFPRGGREQEQIATECARLKVYIGDVWPVLEQVTVQGVQP